jgi:ketosteroid isomerase-like protein
MSQENVERLEAMQRGTAAFNRRDVEGVLEEVDAEIEWQDAFQVLLGGEATTVYGHEGVRDLMREQDEVFAELAVEYSEARYVGDKLVTIGVLRTRGKQSGAATESPLATVVEFKDGKGVRIRTYLDPNEALEAAGLSR